MKRKDEGSNPPEDSAKPKGDASKPRDSGSSRGRPNAFVYREEWLGSALEMIRPIFKDRGHELAKKIRMAVGFPGTGRNGKTQGEAWPAKKSSGYVIEVFIRPDVEDPLEVLTVLVSTLVLSLMLDREHTGAEYKIVATEIGLRGSRREPFCAPILRDRLAGIANALGDFPHDKLDIGTKAIGAPPKQTTRMLAAECPTCRAKIRLARETTKFPGLPICAKDGVAFKLCEGAEKREPDLSVSTASEPSAQQDVTDSAPAGNAERVGAEWTAKFPKDPGETVRARLKQLGRYDGKVWYGVAGDDIDAIRSIVENAGGVFHLKPDDDATAGEDEQGP